MRSLLLYHKPTKTKGDTSMRTIEILDDKSDLVVLYELKEQKGATP